MKKRARDYALHIHDMVAYAEKAERFVAGLTYAAFAINDEKQFAVIYALEVIGEAANRLPRSFTNRHPAVPWAAIIGMRNIMVHGYDTIDPESSGKLFMKICQNCASN